ncbi:MAG: c-type cytochrome domain-containing protein [Bacteroidia bacterium]
MNRLKNTLNARLGLMAFMIMGLFLMHLTACVHEPTMIDPMPRDSMPVDTMQIDTVVIDTSGGLQPCDPDTVYFDLDVLPILISNCALSGCHNEADHASDVILNNYENTIKTTEIKLTDPSDSDIYERITTNDPDEKMPIPPATPLSASDAALILKWIQQGAQDLTCDAFADCDTMEVSYANLVEPILAAKCVGCHGENNPGGGIQLNTHARVATVANAGFLVGTIDHLPGFKKMPEGGAKLPDCEISQIKAWVNEGSPNN